MNVETRKLKDLKVYENNPRFNDGAISRVKLSIKKYGYKVPIVIDSDNVIVAGHTRFAALLELNSETGQYHTINVVVANDLSSDELNQFRIVDNLVAENATWDFTKLRIELDGLDDFTIDDFGDIPDFDIDLDADDQPEPKDSNVVKVSIGKDNFTMTETEYVNWCSYIVSQKNVSVLDFVKSALEIKEADRTYDTF